MKITIIHGQTHKGSTYNITKLFLDKLSDKNTEITEFFMPKDSPSFCVGCFNCFNKGEEQCPHADKIQPIAKAIEEGDLLILESPCYVCGISGQLKTFLDHMGYRWMSHRPHKSMFNKVGICISTSAGAGEKKVTKDLGRNLFWWGVPKIYRYCKKVAASSWEEVKPKQKLQIEKEVTKIANSITKNIGKAKPGVKTKVMFKIMKTMQKSNTWNPTDKEHWVKNGWL